MIALAVDDEKLMLNTLTDAIRESEDISVVYDFTSCQKALDFAKDNYFDIAFLDISMRGMGGLALAKNLLNINPDIKIIFCTGYSDYAVDAFSMHVSGYLLKPITAEAVQKEIDHIKGIKNKEKLLIVKCFGEFEVLCKGNPLKFKRSKTKEVLAIMIDRKGARLSSRTICAVLWPESLDDGKNINYLHQIFIDLKNSLKEVNALAVFNQCGYDYYLNVDKIDCDYYDYLEKGKPDFKGEYMSQYSWAEETCALLWNNK